MRSVLCSIAIAIALGPVHAQKNFDALRRVVVPGNPQASRLLTMPLAAEAGGVAFYPGGKHWASQDDPEWRVLADWVRGAKGPHIAVHDHTFTAERSRQW